jgi:hypothetical protein
MAGKRHVKASERKAGRPSDVGTSMHGRHTEAGWSAGSQAVQGHGNAAMDGRSTRARHTGECGTSTTAKRCEAPGGHACGRVSVAAREVASCSGTAHGCAEPSEACDTS